jgi:hypothetical protein
MKSRISILLIIFILLPQSGCNRAENINQYIIDKENGQIILAYKAFEDFLDSDRSCEIYNII